MPIGYLVVWVIALHDDREDTLVNEELIQEGKKKEFKKKKKMEEMEERAERKGRECENTPTQYKNRNKNRKDKKGQGNRLL
jgi:hypothetical protein